VISLKQKPKPSLQEVVDSIKTHMKTKQWKNAQFIPLPSSFLNSRQWEDEITDEKGESSWTLL